MISPWANLTRRIVTPERMDDDAVDHADLRKSLRFIRQVNHYLGGAASVVRHVQRFAHEQPWPRDRAVRVLDLATGSADIPLALARWAKRTGHRLEITALDRHPKTLQLAADYLAKQPDQDAARQIHLVRGDALRPPFVANTFDYVTTSLFLHHLSDIEAMTLLRVMDRLATHGLIWNDLLRHRRALLWCWAMTRRSASIVQHDAMTSVQAGFRKPEVLNLRDRLDLSYLRYHRHFGHRFTLAGQRRDPK